MWRLFILFMICVLLIGCTPAQTATLEPATPPAVQPALTYTIGPCNNTRSNAPENRVDITFSGGGVQIEQDSRYVCCAVITLELEQEEDVLRVMETNTGEVCRCICMYHISAVVDSLPEDVETVQVWGIHFPDVHPMELLGEANVP